MVITSQEMNLEDGPARQSSRRRRQNFVVEFPSLKNGHSMVCDSVLESAYCIWLEHDPQVVKYYTQPHTFTWMDVDQRYRYTPDFLVVLTHGDSYFTEVKLDFTKQRLSRLTKLDSFHALCIQEGWTFKRRDQQRITGSTMFHTLNALYSRLSTYNEERQMYFYYYLQQREWPTTLGDLVQDSAAPDIGTICYNLFTGRLVADLTQRLTVDLVIDWEPSHA
ncbi:TnsA endonuclease N-terminal domain-containing protein [Pseudomonas sp. BF-B-28]|uniref:TnsA endonuclease N-terminal domain-containing protein n=1 Tax=Pseudomonas sp. BF-B-28 TaxID=2832353 RepID=UPI001CC02867|nr:TnsA endonuclease N-terminal domain-containing protein [Pseudomonas sp. BF-B-28]